jgi:dipeptide/tripeptide permease
MRTFFTQLSLDLTGFWVSAICGLHCVAVPVLVSFAALNVTAGLHESIEYSVLGLSSLLGTASLLPSLFRHHRNIMPVAILLIGFLSIALVHFLIENFETLSTAIGACLIACAHVVNFKLCRKSHSGT